MAIMESDRLERNRWLPLDATPDNPVGFGYKIAWLAVQAASPSDVADCLQLQNRELANWRTGINRAYDDMIFVTPQVDSWIFVVSSILPEPSTETDKNKWHEMMVRLSVVFGECQYFGSHRIVGFAAWGRFVNGKEVRVYAYLGESGEVLVDRGAVTPQERALIFMESERSIVPKSSDEIDDYVDGPSEEDVLTMARAWSIDPTTIESFGCLVGTGIAGSIPTNIR
jgi:hypothetical protein